MWDRVLDAVVGSGSGGGYSVRVVIMMECFSGGCSRMLVVDQSPQVVMVGHNLLKFHDQIS